YVARGVEDGERVVGARTEVHQGVGPARAVRGQGAARAHVLVADRQQAIHLEGPGLVGRPGRVGDGVVAPGTDDREALIVAFTVVEQLLHLLHGDQRAEA